MSRTMIGMAAFFSSWVVVALAAVAGPEAVRAPLETGLMLGLERLSSLAAG